MNKWKGEVNQGPWPCEPLAPQYLKAAESSEQEKKLRNTQKKAEEAYPVHFSGSQVARVQEWKSDG